MVHQHLDDIYELYLLGTLEPKDSAPIQEHVAGGCRECLEQLGEAALSVYLLCQTTRPVRPAAQAKSQLLRRLRRK
ncbi:MAG TPA: hypothetical protein VKU44_11775 [Terriglobia bacterium]|nr:hypothetical protein [Terriglobia bacterium]